MNERRLLAIFAHPDDESYRPGGTLALLARRGVQVWVLCATRGEAGVPGLPPEQAGQIRQVELECACHALDIEPPILLGYCDGTLDRMDEEEAIARVLAVMQQTRPQVLLTWPPHGLSGHPDHVAVSRWTALAFERAVAWGPNAPVALYHLAVPRSVAEGVGLTYLRAWPDEQISLTVDVTPVWEQKLAAIRCHRTQAGASPVLAAAPEKQRLFLGMEHFRRAAARAGQDFFGEIGLPGEDNLWATPLK